MARNSQSKKPEALPMWIAGLHRVELTKDGFETIGYNMYTKGMKKDKIYWGVGLPLYRYELRFESGNKFESFTIRAHNPREAIKLIMERNPNVMGVRE